MLNSSTTSFVSSCGTSTIPKSRIELGFEVIEHSSSRVEQKTLALGLLKFFHSLLNACLFLLSCCLSHIFWSSHDKDWKVINLFWQDKPLATQWSYLSPPSNPSLYLCQKGIFTDSQISLFAPWKLGTSTTLLASECTSWTCTYGNVLHGNVMVGGSDFAGS